MIVPDTDLETVDKIIEQLGDLPAAPEILSKALKMTSDLQSNINDISKQILADQSLALKVISLSNSPMYGQVNRISSISEAIRIIGFDQVKSIIVSASTYNLFKSSTHAKIAKKLWEHSLAAALGSRIIVQKFGILDKEEAYLCGLLHDIGKLVLLQTAPNTYLKIIEKVKETKLPFMEVEGQELGFNHVNVGHALLTKWQFPSNLISQISVHHSSKPYKKEPSKSLGRVIAIADLLAKYIGASFFEAYESEKETDYYIGEMCIDEVDLISLRIDTEAAFNYEIFNYYQ